MKAKLKVLEAGFPRGATQYIHIYGQPGSVAFKIKSYGACAPVLRGFRPKSSRSGMYFSKKYSVVGVSFILPGESKKMFSRLEGCGIKSMWPILKTEMLIYESKAILDEKFFGKIKHL